MKLRDIPIIGLFPRFWLLILVAVVGNFAAVTDLTIFPARWEHTVTDSWVRDAEGVWTHLDGEAWTLAPAKTLFDICGMALYVPGIVALAALCSVLILHLRFQGTIDDDIRSGDFKAFWLELPPGERVRLIAFLSIGTWLGVAWIVAGVTK